MRELADASRTAELISALAASVEQAMHSHPGAAWALVGIKSRGDLIAQRLAEQIGPEHFAGQRVGSLDITLYRDDLSEIGPSARVRGSDVPFSIDGLQVVLVDDVLMTGRSVRSALQSLLDYGRPKRVWLAVLVDRGGRELPIAADMAGLDLANREGGETVTRGGRVEVRLKPLDEHDAVLVDLPQGQEVDQ